ncbi:TRAFAC clade GTPase domain-containing protein [Leptospira weilii]|uniref:TRAFAC clade GTPase domain-containing protein n=1 Tax=Leptospira weilii TaxID=28184 RepID=UPI000772F0A6|nr:hypothetical protein [Leptospira weilii]
MIDYFHNIIGLPNSGKTTFLAALWHLVAAGEVESKLKLDRLVGDHKYLNEVVEHWRRCQKVPRTSQQAENEILIHLYQEKRNRNITLGFSDLSGEAFDSQISKRKLKNSYIEKFNKEGGILYFITADKVEDGISSLDFPENLIEEKDSKNETIAWSSEFLPRDVRHVELLQFLFRSPFIRKRRRLAILISAWDIINSSIEPIKWLEREYPLFFQFINTNQDSFEFQIFGISAQGGDISQGNGKKDNNIRDKLLRVSPSQRIRCISSGYNGHDITIPICWLSEDE